MESELIFGDPRPSLGPRYPQTTGSGCGKEKMKEEVVGLGVELSLSVAESMFLLCDDVRTMLWFFRRLLKYTLPPSSPVLQRLLLVIDSIHKGNIEPKKGGYQHEDNIVSAQWELIKTTWKNFTDGVIVLHRLVMLLRHKDSNSYDDRLLSSAIGKYKEQVVKNIGDKFRVAKDVSEANGFARETIKSNVSESWKSLFYEEAGEVMSVAMASEIFRKLFPINVMFKSFHSEIQSLTVYSPYILGMDFAKGELKEEAVQLGIKLSLYVAESMFLVCDDFRSVLRFCYFLWKYSTEDVKSDSPVGERLLRVIHYVYRKHIKPKNGVYQKGGKSVQWELVWSSLDNLVAGIRDLNTLVSLLTIGGNWSKDGRELTSRVEEAIEKVDEMLRDVEAISKANGFARDDAVMKPKILELWKSLCDKDTEEPRAKKVTRDDMLSDLFPNAGVE